MTEYIHWNVTLLEDWLELIKITDEEEAEERVDNGSTYSTCDGEAETPLDAVKFYADETSLLEDYVPGMVCNLVVWPTVWPDDGRMWPEAEARFFEVSCQDGELKIREGTLKR